MEQVYCPLYDARMPALSVASAKDELRKRLLKSKMYREASEFGDLRIDAGRELEGCFYFCVSGSVETKRFRVYQNRRIEVVEAK